MIRTWLHVAAVVLVVAVPTACATPDRTPSDATSSNSPSVSSTTDAAPVVAVAGTVTDVLHAPRLSDDRWTVIARTSWRESDAAGPTLGTFAADGSYVREWLDGDIGSRNEGRHWLVDPRGSEAVIMTPPHERRQQWIGSDLDQRWLVWKETTSFEIGPEPWTLYAFDRSRHTVSELTRSPLIDGKEPPYVPGFAEPQILGDQVFWAQVVGAAGSARVDVYGCRIADCRPRMISQNSGFPSVVGDDLYLIRLADFSRDAQDPRRMEIARVDPHSGRTLWAHDVRLGQGQSPSGLAATRNHVMWTLAARTGGDLAVVFEVSTSRVWTFSAGGDGRFGDPGIGTGFVVWEGSSEAGSPRVGGYLFDLEDHSVVGIGNGSARGIRANGGLLSWMQNGGHPPAAVDRLVRLVERNRAG